MATLKGVSLSLRIGPLATSLAPEPLIAALESAEVTEATGRRSGYQITFTYGKTSPIATEYLPSGMLDPMNRVILVATLDGVSRVLADGPIKRHDITATRQPGQNRLTLTGEDITGYMDLIDFTGFPFPAMPPFARVALIVAKYAMYGVIPMVIPSPFSVVASPTDKIAQQQGSDFAYVSKLASDAGYVFYMKPGPEVGTNTAYWGPEVRVGTAQPALTLDFDQMSNLDEMSFSVDANVAELAFGFVKAGNFSVPVPAPPVGILKPPLAGRPVVPGKTRLLETERLSAPEVAGMILSGTAKGDPVLANGTIDLARYGQPLNARQLVGLRGAGRAHDGVWYVSSVTHSLTRGAWRQSFQLAREGLMPQKETVTP
mgnify:CR=1 FL=1